MGLDYSFVLAGPAAHADDLLREIEKHLCQNDRARLHAAMPWRPEVEGDGTPGGSGRGRRGIAGLSRREAEHQNSYCFTFLFEEDDVLCAYETAGRLPRENGLVQVGCTWTALHAWDDLVVIEVQAATSAMSRLFENSGSVQRTWASLAAACGAHALFFDTEDDVSWQLLYPEHRGVAKPSAEMYLLEPAEATHLLEDGYPIRSDTYYRQSLELAGIIAK